LAQGRPGDDYERGRAGERRDLWKREGVAQKIYDLQRGVQGLWVNKNTGRGGFTAAARTNRVVKYKPEKV